jgi:probable HAF family extracellular repeat protein
MNLLNPPHRSDPLLDWKKNMSSRHLICACAVALLSTASFLAPANASCPVSFQGLGTLPGDVTSLGLALSNNGRVVVGGSFDASGSAHAFRWTATTGMVALGALPPDFPNSEALATNADGSVIVGIALFFDERLAFRWTQATGVQALTPVTAPTRAISAAGISARGNVITGAAAVTTGLPEIYRWTSSGGVVPLGAQSSQAGNDMRWGVSFKGDLIAGTAANEDHHDFAFRWTAVTGVVALPMLPSAIESGASGVSKHGDVIVGFNRFGDNSREATIWDQTQPHGLGMLDDDFTSVALKTSKQGHVIVGASSESCLGCSAAHAVIWDRRRHIHDLREVLVEAGLGQELEGWSLVEANGVSDDGRVVSGIGINPDEHTEAFVATICPQLLDR